MKTKTMRNAMKVGLAVFVCLTTWGFAGTANAQTTLAGKFNLPYEVHWGTRVVPAGQYTISMDPAGAIVFVCSKDGNTAFYTPIPTRNSNNKGAAALFVMVRGHERVVRSLNLPKRGFSLIYQPATSAERELLAKSEQVEAVPLITAGK